jgi:hypothetical protein
LVDQLTIILDKIAIPIQAFDMANIDFPCLGSSLSSEIFSGISNIPMGLALQVISFCSFPLSHS